MDYRAELAAALREDDDQSLAEAVETCARNNPDGCELCEGLYEMVTDKDPHTGNPGWWVGGPLPRG